MVRTAWRSLLRNRAFTLINLFGLTLGIAVFLLIAEYLAFEWGVNRFHRQLDRIYRVSAINSREAGGGFLPPGFGAVMQRTLPAVEAVVRIADGVGAGVITLPAGVDAGQAKSFREEKMSYVDGDFFQVFSFPREAGAASLQEPNTMALSASMSRKLFAAQPAIGRVVRVSNQFGNALYRVVAVYRDMPAQSDVQANVLLSYATLANRGNRNGNDWADPAGFDNGYVNIFLLLKNSKDAKRVGDQALAQINNIHTDPDIKRLVLQPMKHLHLAPSFDYPLQTFGNMKMVLAFGVVALLILFIAWINYVNLYTAQALRRAKEVGVRKVLGASRRQLAAQTLVETLLVALMASALALVLVSMVQPWFNRLTEQPYSLWLLAKGVFLAPAVLLVILFSVVAGSYITFIIGSLNPVKGIRGQWQQVSGGIPVRKALVVFQFAASVVFIIATAVLYRQLRYMQTQALGMSVAQRLVVAGPAVINSDNRQASGAFKNELAKLSFVSEWAGSNNVPGLGYNFSTQGITRLNPQPGDEKKQYSMFIIDEHFLNTYAIQLKEGSGFTQAMADQGWSAARKVMLNESAVRALGFEAGTDVVGQQISWGQPFEIVGVVEDYHHLSLRESIKPMIFLPAPADGYFTIRMSASRMQEKLARIEALYKKIFPNEPFDYFFADEIFDRQYQAEQRLGSVFFGSALVAIVIACLGLFGLAAFAVRQRVKEIGIRKVLGAGTGAITLLISGDFLKLVWLSVVIATPVAWWLMHNWLQGFAYRTALSWWIFGLSGLAAVVIAFATVGIQAVRAALANPVKSLRSE